MTADSTLVAMRKTFRRLTGLIDSAAINNTEIDNYLNVFITQQFPAAIKVDQLKERYTFYTTPNMEKYTLDLNEYQAVKPPLYINGREAKMYYDRSTFYRVWNKTASKFDGGTGDGVTTTFAITIGSPVLPESLVIGSVDTTGTAIQVHDNGSGILIDQNNNSVGAIDYPTGVIGITFNTAPGSSESIDVWARVYSASRPLSMLFWNDEIRLRPVPDGVYSVEFEVIKTPTQFLATTSAPTLNQWWQYATLGAAINALRDRRDVDGVADLMPFFQDQEGLVLERQANERIGTRTGSIYTDPYPSSYAEDTYYNE